MHVVSAVCRLLFFLAGVFVFVDVDVGEGGVDVVAVTLLPCLRVPRNGSRLVIDMSG